MATKIINIPIFKYGMAEHKRFTIPKNAIEKNLKKFVSKPIFDFNEERNPDGMATAIGYISKVNSIGDLYVYGDIVLMDDIYSQVKPVFKNYEVSKLDWQDVDGEEYKVVNSFVLNSVSFIFEPKTKEEI